MNGNCFLARCSGRPAVPSPFIPLHVLPSPPSAAGTTAWPSAMLESPPPTTPRAGALRAPTRDAAGRLDAQQRLTLALWIIILLDPQFLIASFGLTPILRVPLVLTVLLGLSLVLKPRKGDWLWGILAWIVLMAIDLPFAYNRGVAMEPFRTVILFYLVGISVVRRFQTPRSADKVLIMLCVVQYVWWGVMGVKHGQVTWHPNLDNFDGYGPLMACGVGPAYYYASATRIRWRRGLALFTAALCVVGVVSAFARGGVVALVVTGGYIWLRSPHKLRTAGLMIIGMLLVVIAASMIDGTTRGDDTRANFWDEMGTIFNEGDGGTESDRKHLWAAAVEVFKVHPVLGVGANNFGPAAVTIIQPGEVKGAVFDDNPAMLYGRALHSNYFQLLSEFGLVGVAIYIFLIGQFWFRSAYVIRHARVLDLRSAGIDDARALLLGLESGMVAYLVSGIFFNQLFTSWFFCLFVANALLYSMARRRPAALRSAPFTSRHP